MASVESTESEAMTTDGCEENEVVEKPPESDLDGHYCLICCTLIPVDSIANSGGDVENDQTPPPVVVKQENESYLNQMDLFKCMLKLFDVKLNKRKMLGEGSDCGVDLGDHHPSFCSVCKKELEMLYEVNKKLKELEQALHLGTLKLKDLMTTSEQEFQAGQVYDKDERYYNIRKKVLGIHVTGRRKLKYHNRRQIKSENTDIDQSAEEVNNNPDAEGPVRRSTRRATKSLNTSSAEDGEGGKDDDLFGNTEVEHIKVEVDLDFEMDNDNFDDDLAEFNSDSDASFSPGTVSDDDDDEEESAISEEPEEEHSDSSGKRSRTVPKPKKKRKSGMEGPRENCERKPRKTKRRRDDDNHQGQDGKRRRGSYIKAKLIEDPKSGNCEYLDIQFEKLGPEKYRCSQCKEIVNNHSTIKKHTVRVHTDRFVCHICGQHKASGSDLNKHIREVHEGKTRKAPEKTMECPICGKPFGHKTALEFHKVTHYSEEDKREAAARGEKLLDYKDRVRLHQCGACGVVFNNITWLKKHEKIKHPKTEEEKHEVLKICPDCGKSFSEAYLKAHVERYHSNLDESVVKPYVCTFCSKRFYSSARLVQHKRTHTGERPFKCETCDKDFISKNRLKYHIMQNHENRKPFACTNCNAAFVTSYKLRRHMATVHEGKSQKDWNSKKEKAPNPNSHQQDSGVSAANQMPMAPQGGGHSGLPSSLCFY